MGYFTYKEDEAYREGRSDAHNGRRNYDYDEHFGSDSDKAYYDGRRDEEREEQRRRESYDISGNLYDPISNRRCAYLKSRFIPLSTIDEKIILEERLIKLCSKVYGLSLLHQKQ